MFLEDVYEEERFCESWLRCFSSHSPSDYGKLLVFVSLSESVLKNADFQQCVLGDVYDEIGERRGIKNYATSTFWFRGRL